MNILKTIIVYFTLHSKNGILIKSKKPIKIDELSLKINIKLDELISFFNEYSSIFVVENDGTIHINNYEESFNEIIKNEKNRIQLTDYAILMNNVKDVFVIELIKKIESEVGKELNAIQIIVEYYKRLKGYDSIQEWDRFNFFKCTSFAKKLIDEIGFVKSIHFLKWLSESKARWYIYNCFQLYPWYAEDPEKKNKQFEQNLLK